jgi:hypothetical protein
MGNETFASSPIPNRNLLVEKPVGILAILTICVLFIVGMRWSTNHEPLLGDPGVYSVIGHELLNGRQLYADMWDHKPPAIHVTYAVAELVTGYGPQQIYLLNLAALTITLLGLYRAGTLLGGPRAGLGAGLLWAIGSTFPIWQGYQPNTEVFVNAGLVWSYCLIYRLSTAPTWWRACAFGATVGIASLYKQVAVAPAGLIAIAYICGAVRADGERWLRLRHMIVAAVVSLSIWVACVAWFWGRGSLADFYDAVFVYNRSYAGSMVQNLIDSFGSRHKRYMIAVTIPCLLLPYLAGPRMSRAQRNGWLMLAGWAAGCHIAAALAGKWVEHYYELWMPVYALAGGALVAALWAGMLEKRSAWRCALLVMVFGPLAIRFFVDLRYDTAPWLVYEPGSFAYQIRYTPRAAGHALNRLLLPGERLYALGPPGQSAPLYFYTRQDPPSGVIYDFPLGPGSPLAGPLEERIVRDLDGNPPDLIVLFKDTFLPALEGKPATAGQRLAEWISPRYSRRYLDAPKQYIFYARRGSALERRLAEREES